MSDQQKQDKKYPKIATGVLIVNEDGKFFLMKSPKWKNKFICPGGHVDWGEDIEHCVIREAKEESGLDVENLRYLQTLEFINSPEFDEVKHIVGINYVADTKNDQTVQLDGREGTEFVWLTADELLKREDVHWVPKENVKIYLQKYVNKKSSIFHRECIKCEEFKKEAAEFKLGWQRALADYKNLQAETSKRRGEWAQMSETQILEEFIPVYEHLKLAINNEQLTSDASPWVVGVKYVLKQFADILKSHGVEEIKTLGETFDPKFHEAVGEEEIEGKETSEIIKEISGGYKVGDKVIRAARVIINK